MGALHVQAMLLFQDTATMVTDVHVIMICEVILTAIVVLLLLGIAVAGLVIYSKVNGLAKTAEAKAQPLLAQATPLVAKGKEIAGHVNDIVADLKPKIAKVTSDLEPRITAVAADLQPKIASVTSDVQHISSVVRSKVDELGATVTKANLTAMGYMDTAQDVNSKAKGQVARVNGMVSDVLTATQNVGQQIEHGIKVPVQKIAGWVTTAKIGIEKLAEKVPFLHQVTGYQPSGAARTAKSPAPRRGGPVPVPPSAGTRIVHSAEDEARFSDVTPKGPAE